MTPDWRLSLYNDQDLGGLVALSHLQPGKAANVTADYVRWMHNGNPAGKPIIALAKENGTNKVIGQVWLMPLRIQVGDEVQLGSLSFYGLVDPVYQRQGIFTKLVPYCSTISSEMGIRFAYGFPNHRSFPVFIKRLNWTHLGTAREFIRPVQNARLISRRIKLRGGRKFLGVIANLAGNFLFRPKPLPAKSVEYKLVEVCTTSSMLDEFWHRVKNKYPVIIVRDGPFTDWRYTRIPDRHYRIWGIRKGQTLSAYIVLRRVNLEGIDCGMIVDFLVEPSEDGELAGEVLLSRAYKHFQAKDIDLAGCMMIPGAQEIGLLTKQGFIQCPPFLQSQPHPVILQVNPGSPNGVLLSGVHNWFLTLGDFDAV
jgi:GNAT superfamily N-acetyltransferase